MKKKEFLTEAKRKAIISDKEKAIIESFAKTFNKIKRIDENEINEFEELNSVYSRQQQYGINPEIDPEDLSSLNTYKVEVIGKEAEKDGGYKHSWVYEIEANSPEEAEAKAADDFNEEMRLSDIYLFSAKVISNPTDNDVVQGRGIKLAEYDGNEGGNEQSVIPNEIFEMEEFEIEQWDVVEFNYGKDNSILEIEFTYTETETACFYLKAIFNFYYKITGSYRRATWGYYGGSPEEYPEEEFIPDLQEIVYVECTTGKEYKLTEEMKEIVIPQVIEAFDGIEEKVSVKLWDEVHSWGPDGD